MFRSNDDPEVIAFNRSVLPVYYGLLRLACEHSAQFTRELAMHGNMTWAFEYLTARINQYPKVRGRGFLVRKGLRFSQPSLRRFRLTKTACMNHLRNGWSLRTGFDNSYSHREDVVSSINHETISFLLS